MYLLRGNRCNCAILRAKGVKLRLIEGECYSIFNNFFIGLDLMSKFLPNADGLLAPLLPWWNDSGVSEIMMNKPGQIYVEKKGVMTSFSVPDLNERAVHMLFQLIANESQQVIGKKTPLLSASLYDGSRIQLVSPPTARDYTFSIRRQSVIDLTLDDISALSYYSKTKTFNLNDEFGDDCCEDEKKLRAHYHHGEWDLFIRGAILLKKNIVISGGTSTGKTTFLSACLRHIPVSERIIILEDAREIITPHKNQVNLLASKGGQGLSKTSMQDLVQCCLRLRPDRIIVGEVRGKEVLDFLGACSTGHSGSLTCIHANNPRIAIMRMTQLYKQNNVPSMTDKDIQSEINEVVDVIIQIAKSPHRRHIESIYYKNA